MEKPQTRAGYTLSQTATCERALVTLLRGLGPWKESVYLVGGLTPRYLAPDAEPPHAGTLDVDVVVDIQLLAGIGAYRSLERNLHSLGFRPVDRDDKPTRSSWRWKYRTDDGATIVLELLTDDPEKTGGRVQVIPGQGAIKVLNIPHSSIVFDHYQVHEVTAELLDANGVATEYIRHADIVSFSCLKAFALDDRFERKDAHDLVYCIEHAPGGLDAVAKSLRAARAGRHAKAVERMLRILRTRFVSDDSTEGHLKDGPVAVAKFDPDAGEPRETQLLRQRNVAELIDRLLALVG